ncbi:MAG: hypothetical protein WD334_00330, partial [Chitinophagales bacterium]
MKIIVRNIIILILLLLPATLCAQVDPIYQWSNGDTTAIINVSPAQTTVYYVTVTYGSRVIYDSITVEVDSNTYSTDTVTACGSYTWRDSITYTSNNNTATDTILNSAGCDSIITLDLTILSPTYATINESACDTFVSPSGNYTWTSSGTYNDTLVNSEGCDSVITINLDIIGGNLNTESITACDSYTWPVNGQTYFNSGSYNDTLTSSQGCDSVLVLDLTINNSTSSSQTVSECNAYTWQVNGQTYTASGIYRDTLLNSVNCDSVLTLDLTILNSSASTINETACDSFISPSGNYTWTSSGSYNDTLVNSQGCDSLITVNLTVNYSSSNSENITACDEYTWLVNGQTYTTGGSYSDTLQSTAGCDSVLMLDLTINNSSSSSELVSECNAYTWPVDGQTYTASGIYRDTLLNSVNCDSVLTLDLTILNSSASTINETACDSFISPSGNYTWTSSGSYNDTLVNSQGCDSLITVNLTVNYSSSNSENITACDEYTWLVNGQTYTTGGSYSDTLQSTAGCDSILVLNLTINNSTSSTNTVNTCDDYTWAVNGNTYTQSGIYYDTIPNTLACDSFLTLDLTIDNSIVNTTDTTVCDEYTWPVDGQSYDSSGTYRDTLLSSTGCDSILVLNLTIIPNTIYNSSQTVCDAFTWSLNGQTYTNSGTYYDTTAMAVCDSIVELDLTILNSTSSNINETACDSFVSPSGNYTWTSSGTYNDTLLNAVGCDSLISVNLTINNSSNSTDNISTCNSYTWPVNGQTYTTSGTYADTLQSVAGCDSILTLILNIGSSYSGFDTVVSCNSYTWPVNGITYTNGGTYYDTIGSGIGCDSTFQLDLTLNFNSSSSENITACDEYTWPVNGQ